MVVIKNFSVRPKAVPNDGAAEVEIRCTVFTAHDHASIRSVRLDLRHTTLFMEKDLRADSSNILRPSGEGDYVCTCAIPRLMDTGRYRIPVEAVDSTGETGRALGRLTVRYKRKDDAPPVSTPEFSASLEEAGKSRFVGENRAEVLEDGASALERRLELIENAQHQINLQSYTLGHTGAGGRILDALIKKADQGVEVNVILNADSQIPTSARSVLRLKLNQFLSQLTLFEEERSAGEAASHEPVLGRLKSGRGAGGVNLLLFRGPGLPDPEETGGKEIDHWLAKIRGSGKSREENELIPKDWFSSFKGPGGLPALPLLDYAIHEKIMVVDGERALIGGRNLEDQYFDHWVDLDLILEGPVVDQIQEGFLRTFEEISAIDGEAPQPTRLLRARAAREGFPCQFVQSRPWAREIHTVSALVDAVQAARKSFYAGSQYVILPDCLLRDAILEAAGRGVDVRIVTNSFRTCSEVSASTGYFISVKHFERLLEAGVRIFEVKGLEDEKAPQPYYHVKEFIFDGALAAVGSFNLSVRSCYIESENLLFVDDPEFSAHRQQAFLSFIETRTTEVTLDTVQRVKAEHGTRIDLSQHLELLF